MTFPFPAAPVDQTTDSYIPQSLKPAEIPDQPAEDPDF